MTLHYCTYSVFYIKRSLWNCLGKGIFSVSYTFYLDKYRIYKCEINIK